MPFWIDHSFNYRGFKCIWDHAREYFEIREYGVNHAFAYAGTKKKCKDIIDKEIDG